MYYLVIALEKLPPAQSGQMAGYDINGTPIYTQARQQVRWDIVGVFEAETAEKACQAAARKAQRFGSFFAAEGFPWGVDLIETDAKEFGVDTPEMSKLKQLENRSREMEKEAGIE